MSATLRVFPSRTASPSPSARGDRAAQHLLPPRDAASPGAAGKWSKGRARHGDARGLPDPPGAGGSRAPKPAGHGAPPRPQMLPAMGTQVRIYAPRYPPPRPARRTPASPPAPQSPQLRRCPAAPALRAANLAGAEKDREPAAHTKPRRRSKRAAILCRSGTGWSGAGRPWCHNPRRTWGSSPPCGAAL